MAKYTVNGYLNRLREQQRPALSLGDTGDRGAWLSRQRALREAFIRALGPMPEPAALEPRVLEEVEMPGYRRLTVELTETEGLVMPCYVLIPEGIGPGERRAAVVAVPGHGSGMREAMGLDEAGRPAADAGYQKRFPEALCRRGFVVIVPELLGFGQRRWEGDEAKPLNHSACHQISTALWMYGQTMAGMRVFDVKRCLDYLATLPFVDAGRMGAMGISGGGLAAGFAAMVDDRIRAICVSGYFNTFADSVLNVFHCVDNYLYGIMQTAELPDLACLIAPRPLVMECGRQDPIFPFAASEACYRQLEQAYRMLGCPERLAMDAFDGDHQISGRISYDFLARYLMD